MRNILIVIIIFVIIYIFLFFRRVKKEKGRPEKINRCVEILGLKPGASQEEVNQAYRDLVSVLAS